MFLQHIKMQIVRFGILILSAYAGGKLAKNVKLFLLLIIATQLLGKNILLDGIVVDANTNEPISNVNITIKKTFIGTNTNIEGYYRLAVNSEKADSIIFSHIKYKRKIYSIKETKKLLEIKMDVRILQLHDVNFYDNINQYEYKQDIRNSVTTISPASFENVGNIDMSDILKNEQSIHIEEQLNGEKNISIRGSNSDEVMMLYDGIPINNNFNNNSDLSIINQEYLDHIDIIKGSSVATIGAYNSSAVLNFVPKYKYDYLLKFNQQFGSYNSGKWNLNFNENLFGINTMAGITNSASQLNYVDSTNNGIDNISSNIIAGITFPFGKKIADKKRHKFNIYYLQNDREYNNKQISDKLKKTQSYLNFKFSEQFEKIGKSDFYFSNQEASQSHDWISDSSISNRTLNEITKIYNANHIFQLKDLDIFLGYQKKESDISENYNSYNDKYERNSNKFSTGMKFINSNITYPFGFLDFQFNFIYDKVIDDYNGINSISLNVDSTQDKWNEKSFLLSTSFIGAPDNYMYKLNFNFSSGFRIPSIYQKITALKFPVTLSNQQLLTEHKSNFEVVNTLSIDKFNNKFLSKIIVRFSGFSNIYTNKMRMIKLKGSTIEYYDNYDNAKIYGIESSITPLFIDGIIEINGSLSKYFIDDMLAFPFKPTDKISANFSILYHSLTFNINYFKESGSIGLIVDNIDDNGILELKELTLDSFSSLDMQIKKEFTLWRLKTYLAFSGKNILNDKLIMEGIALKDRRFYITGGIEFK
ncbi:MAG: TonB-dependent receptor plug domain-containing protein [Candidatus Marinimicrobia bacterium]|nr:TonB-dependent receptor plug domain-containing protein [Candidatus Neomarinimicrobiota bacterium]